MPERLPVLVVRLVLPPEPPVVDLAPDRHLVELDQRQVREDPVVEDDVARAPSPVISEIALDHSAAAPSVSASWNAPPVQ